MHGLPPALPLDTFLIRPGHPDGRAPRGHARRALHADETAVSEVIGYILVFAIVSMILLLSMIAFNKVAADARVNVISLRAQSVGTRVASLIVEASLAAEQEGTTTSVRFLADLPSDLEGVGYTVYLEPAGGGHVERVRVNAPAVAVDVTSPIFSADAPPTFSICATSAVGGRIYVAFNIDTYPTQNCLFLEAAP